MPRTSSFALSSLNLKRAVKLLTIAGVSAGLLAGCVTARDTLSDVIRPTKLSYLDYAGANGPVLVQAVNTPYAAGNRETAEQAARDSAGAIIGRDVTFTSDPAQADRRNHRIIIVFNPHKSVSNEEVCEAEKNFPKLAPASSELRLHGALCSNGEALAASIADGPAPKGLNDPAFRELVRALMREMFSGPEIEGRNEPLIRIGF